MPSNSWDSSPKTRIRFYWFIPYATVVWWDHDPQDPPYEPPGPRGKFDTELWVFAVKPEGCPVESERLWPHKEFRSYETGESECEFQVVWPTPPDPLFNETPSPFPAGGLDELKSYGPGGPLMGPFVEGAPALVIASISLPADRQYIAFARVKDRNHGDTPGDWHRVAQSRCDFIDESGRPVLDLEVSDHRPRISGAVSVRVSDRDTESTSIPRAQVRAARIHVSADVTSEVPLTSVFINGQKVLDSPQSPCTAIASFPIGESCPQVRIVAVTLAGLRSEAVRAFVPTYDDEGRVTSYDAEGGTLVFDDQSPDPRRYRLRYEGIPYEVLTNFSAHVLSGNRTAASEIGFAGGGVTDYFGPACEAPANILGVTLQSIIEGNLLVAPPDYVFSSNLHINDPSRGAANVSAEIILVRRNEAVLEALDGYSPEQGGVNVLAVHVGELVAAHVLGHDNGGTAVTGTTAGAVAAGVVLVSADPGTPRWLPQVKAGDVVKVVACNGDTAFSEEENGDADLTAHLTNEADDGTEDTTTARDESVEGYPIDTADIKLVVLDQPPIYPEEPPQDPPCCGSDAKPPGWVRKCLTSKEAIRLVTQDDRPKDNEPKHQILPNGRLKVEVASLNLVVHVPAIEVIRRWRIEGEPSVQPAFAGTSRRVAGPGTHRVGGLHQKLDDGSVYVHSGEFFQAAEDLLIKGKMLNVVFRRVHLSHSLFTTDVGRNWDWMGNMRAVEMLNGDVLLMNGEAQVEKYVLTRSENDSEEVERRDLVKPITVTHLTKGQFNYEELWKQRRYESPPGAYRSLIKAEPAEMDGMAVPDEDAENARFYLVGKGGTIWTFVEDVRFRTNADVDEIQTDENETPPGVRAQYLLVSIHHRNQANFVKLQRDAYGVVDAIIDDMGRVTRLVHNKASHASADWFLTSVKDFAGRELAFARPAESEGDSRDLAGVDGPLHPNQGMRYTYLPVSSESAPRNGPTHRLRAVTDPRGRASSESSRPYLEITAWQSGRVRAQEERSILSPNSLAEVDTAGKLTSAGLSGEVSFRHEFTYNGTTVRHVCTRTSGPYQRTQFDHRYELRQGSAFTEVRGQTVALTPPVRQGGLQSTAVTTYRYNTQGEVIAAELPSHGTYLFDYVTDPRSSQIGNLRSAETRIRNGLVSRTTYVEYDARFNLPKVVSVDCYQDDDSFPYPSHLRTVYDYHPDGSLRTVTEPTVLPQQASGGTYSAWVRGQAQAGHRNVGFEYNDDGTLSTSISKRGVSASYHYYAPDENRAPGDAHDAAGMLAAIEVKGNSLSGRIIRLASFESDQRTYGDRRPHLARTADFITTIKPNILGDPVVTVDANGQRRSRELNILSLPIEDERGIGYDYNENDDLISVRVPAIDGPEGGSAAERITRTDYDSLGDVVATCVKATDGRSSDLVTVSRHDVWGNPVVTLDEEGIRANNEYDSRGLLIRRALSETLSVGIGGVSFLTLPLPTSSAMPVEAFEYDINGNMSFHRDPNGWCEGWKYDELNRLTHHVSTSGLLTLAKYGRGGQLLRETRCSIPSVASALSDACESMESTGPGNDGLRRVRSEIERCASDPGRFDSSNPSNALSDVTYWRDGRGRVWKEARLRRPAPAPNANGTSSEVAEFGFARTGDDLLVAEIVNGVAVRRYGYDDLGRLVTEYSGPRETTREYDGVGNAIRAKMPDRDLYYRYDEFGNLLGTRSANHNEWIEEASYDREGNVIARWALPDTTELYQLDWAGRWTEKDALYTDPPTPEVRLFTRRLFDAQGRLTREELRPAGSNNPVTKVEYSDFSLHGARTVTVTSGARSARTLSGVVFDASGNMIRWTDANGTTFLAEYDAARQAVHLNARCGNHLMHRRVIKRDALGRPVRLWDQEAMHYEGPGNPQPTIGEFAAAVVSTLQYDTLGRPLSENQAIREGVGTAHVLPSRQMSFVHNDAGGRTKTIYPACGAWPFGTAPSVPGSNQPLEVEYTLDELNRPTAARWRQGGQAPSSWQQIVRANNLTYNRYDYRPDALTLLPLGSGQLGAGMTSTWVSPARHSQADWRLGDKMQSTSAARSAEGRGNGLSYERNNCLRYATRTSGLDVTTRRGLALSSDCSPAEQVTEVDHDRDIPDGLGLVRSERSETTTREKYRGADAPNSRQTSDRSTTMTPDSAGSLDEIYLRTRHGIVQFAWNQECDFSNNYSNREQSAFRLPGRATVQPHRERRGASDFSLPVARYNDGQTCREPGAEVHRNAFGQASVLVNPDAPTDPSQRCLFRYDALGRLVLKKVPSAIRLRPHPRFDTLVIEVGPGPKTDAGDIRFRSLALAIAQIRGNDYRQNPLKDITIRLFVTTLSQDDVVALNHLGKWQVPNGPLHESAYPQHKWTRFTIEAAAGTVSVPASVRVNDLPNMTFRGLMFYPDLRINYSSGVIIDSCTVTALTVTGQCKNLQVQNCEIHDIAALSDPGIRFDRPSESSSLISHNKFLCDVVAIRVDRDENDPGRFQLGVLNNIFSLPDAVSTSAVWPMSVNDAISKCSCYSDYNLYSVPAGGAATPGSSWFRYGNRHSLWIARTRSTPTNLGQLGAGKGCAHIPGQFSECSPVILDRGGRFRDPKYPTIGPDEHDVPGTTSTVLCRYLYDGSGPAARETYRYSVPSGGVDFSRAETTRFVPVLPGGPTLYADTDGTVDVDFPGRDGAPLFWYRTREGSLSRPRAPTDSQMLALPATIRPGIPDYYLRNTGILTPLALPMNAFVEFPPWALRVLEPDFLAGRRGVVGWNGRGEDHGLLMSTAEAIQIRLQRHAEELQEAYPSWLNWMHGVLDVIGIFPVVGDIVDVAHAGIYSIESAYWRGQGEDTFANLALLGTGTSLVSALPLLGDTAKGVKWGVREAVLTGVRRGIVQYGTQFAGGQIGRQIGGERGEFWGSLAGGLTGGVINARMAWRASRRSGWGGRFPEESPMSGERGRGVRSPQLARRILSIRTQKMSEMGRTHPITGEMTLDDTLRGLDLLETVRHESVHVWLIPRPRALAYAKYGLYRGSNLLRMFEETIAETYATRSLRRGVKLAWQYQDYWGLLIDAPVAAYMYYRGISALRE